jgi:hypothetical protein
MHGPKVRMRVMVKVLAPSRSHNIMYGSVYLAGQAPGATQMPGWIQ